jgi:Zn-dependent protease
MRQCGNAASLISSCYSRRGLPQIDLVTVLASFAILVVSLSFHEAAHAWTANQLGDPTARLMGRLTLNPLAHIDLIGTVVFPLVAMLSNVPLIGWAKPVPVSWNNLRSPRRDFAIVAIAGPISNLVLAGVGAVTFRLLLATSGGSLFSSMVVWETLLRFVELNVLLALFNLIPVPPLDGGNVLMGIVPAGTARAINQLRPYGFLILYALMFLGVFSMIATPVLFGVRDWLLR